MTNTNNAFSAAAVKKAIWQLLSGKVVSALATFVYMVMLAREMSKTDFGLYVAIFAFVEIFYLATGFGLSTLAQKYVTEFRATRNNADINKLTTVCLCARLLLSILAAGLFYVANGIFVALFPNELTHELLVLFSISLVLESMYRYFGELLPAMLLQGRAQLVALIRNISCLAGLLLVLSSEIRLFNVIVVELTASSVACLLGLSFLCHYFVNEGASGGVRANLRDGMNWRQVTSVSLQFYLVQVLGQLYGVNSLRLLVAKTVGVVEAGAYGFAQNLADILRNYTPGYLLLGVVRPMFIGRFAEGKSTASLAEVFSFIFKLNIFSLAVVFAVILVSGDEWLALLSKGKYPDAAPVFAILIVLVAFQCMHLLLTLVNMAVGKPAISLFATFTSTFGIFLAWFLGRKLGCVGVALGGVSSEVIWCLVSVSLLSKKGFPFSWGVRPMFVLLLSCIVAVSIGMAVKLILPSGLFNILLTSMLVTIVYLIVAYIFKPFTLAERNRVNNMLPGRLNLFVW